MLYLYISPLKHFQKRQDGAQPQFSRYVTEVLSSIFPRRCIGRSSSDLLPPRRPNLMPLNFFFRGYVVKIRDLNGSKARTEEGNKIYATACMARSEMSIGHKQSHERCTCEWKLNNYVGSVTAQLVCSRLPTTAAQIRSQVKSRGICGGRSGIRQVLSEYFNFPCQFSFHHLFHTHHRLSSWAGTTGQIAADVPSGLNLSPPQEIKKMILIMYRTEVHSKIKYLSEYVSISYRYWFSKHRLRFSDTPYRYA
jgi:hypothetical protein